MVKEEARVTLEEQRLMEVSQEGGPWKKWGPYLSERQWGTVREDYSSGGDAWAYFTHDQSRSRAYRWGEDGLAGFADDQQHLCFALALWNGKDPILKERLFGLTNSERNHGEDVKECYYYLDSTPTHSYMKFLYKYPQSAYPYNDLIQTNRQRTRNDLEYELIDTGIFDEDRYFDVFVEYAKESPEEILIRISIANRGPDEAQLHVLPTLWFRNTWSWDGAAKPMLKATGNYGNDVAMEAGHPTLGWRHLYGEGNAPLLFTENETNTQRLFGTPNATPYVKDAFHEFVVHGRQEAANPDRVGTKAAAHYQLTVGPGETEVIRLRLGERSPAETEELFGEAFDRMVDARRQEADEFYQSITPSVVDAELADIMRQALAGMLWTKQYYSLDMYQWLKEHGVRVMEPKGPNVRNKDWFHMVNHEVISMPDKWEYPWYAAWDLAFHTIALSPVDMGLAKQQLELLLGQNHLHPNGQLPAYEWNFSDVNPPVHAWAALYLYKTEQEQRGKGDLSFLKRVFDKLLLNFTWWVNRKDRFGRNVFEGGFLGMDNIGVFDRSAPLPTGGYLEQADGTAWMALFCQNMFEMSTELAAHDPTYEDMALKFAEHFVWIAAAINRIGPDGLWDEEDGFYYDVMRLPDGSAVRLKVRSLVGLLPLCATTVIEPWQRERVPRVLEGFMQRLKQMPEVANAIHPTGPGHRGVGGRGIAALVNRERLTRILSHVLDENEFLSPYGIRALSRYHLEHPYTFHVNGQENKVSYLPAESDNGMFGGNSNWRGPIWFPMNTLIIRGLTQYYLYYGDNLKVECPTGSGNMMNLLEVSSEIARRLGHIYRKDAEGNRPVFGGSKKLQTDPYWRDNLLFYEYFHGDNGAGLGASHQTGWTGVIAKLTQLFAELAETGAERALAQERGSATRLPESVR
jgi:hypothetical protein